MDELLQKVQDLERRIRELEARPVYVPAPQFVPVPRYQPPPALSPPWVITC